MPKKKTSFIDEIHSRPVNVRHKKGFPAEVDITVRARLTFGPDGEGLIGMPMESLSISDKDKILGSVSVCMGCGIELKFGEHTYSVEPVDMLQNLMDKLPGGGSL